jgi:hypothetical protein
LQNGISLADQKELGEYKRWLYFYFINAAQQKEEKMMKEKMEELFEVRGGDYTGKTKKIDFPKDFISKINELKKKGLK